MRYKRQCTHSIKHNAKCDEISCRIRIWSPFSKWPVSGTYPYHLLQDVPHATSDTHANWQFHRKRHFKQYSAPKTIKSHGYALLLDSISKQTRPFPCLLETRNGKPGVLFYQTSLIAPPHINAANIPLYRGYLIEIVCGGLFITHSHRKSSSLQYKIHPWIQLQRHSQITIHSELIHKQTGYEMLHMYVEHTLYVLILITQTTL